MEMRRIEEDVSQERSSLSSNLSNVEEELARLTVVELLTATSSGVQFSRSEREDKRAIVQRIVADAPCEVLSNFLQQAQARRRLVEEAKAGNAADRLSRKRKRREELAEERRRKLRRVEVYEPEQFLRIPTREELKKCYTAFHLATAASTLYGRVCAVCARECAVLDEGITTPRLDQIPGRERLRPSHPHPAHRLVDGLLLEPAGLSEQLGVRHANVCSTCLHSLEMKNHKQPPKHALANGTWIGKVPFELKGLTVPEQMLIALLFPRVYVFKLFPKKNMGVRSVDQLQRAMRGNVSTYELNATAAADMVEGRLMPRQPTILASLISVTFIGRGKLPKDWLRSTFRVRRAVVRRALYWLKNNNHALYGNIEIDSARLELLPEDDVPEEICAIVRHSSDEGVIDQESAGYVPLDEDNEGAYIARMEKVHVGDVRIQGESLAKHAVAEDSSKGKTEEIAGECGRTIELFFDSMNIYRWTRCHSVTSVG